MSGVLCVVVNGQAPGVMVNWKALGVVINSVVVNGRGAGVMVNWQAPGVMVNWRGL